MPIKIDKPWDGLKNQKARDTNGREWTVTSLVEHAKDRPVLDIPLEHLCIAKSVRGVRLRDFVAHMKLVLDADLTFPIILDEDGDIFDGIHRVMKALLEGQESIKAVRLVQDPPPDVFGKND